MMIETTGAGSPPVRPVHDHRGAARGSKAAAARAGGRSRRRGDPGSGPGRPPGESAAARSEAQIAWGPGPRASQALMLAVRARALLGGRLAPSLDDVVALAPPVLRHRMALTFTARAEGVTLDQVIQRLCAEVGG